jgi:hypothetical protein
MTLFEKLKDKIEFDLIQKNVPVQEQAVQATSILKDILLDAISKGYLKEETDLSQIQFNYRDLVIDAEPLIFPANEYTSQTIWKLKEITI